MSNTIELSYPNAFITNLLIQGYFENLSVFNLKFFSYKSEKEKFIKDELKSILNEELAVANIFYYIFSKLEKLLLFYKDLDFTMEEEKELGNKIFFCSLANLASLYYITNDKYKLNIWSKHIPITNNFFEEFYFFIEKIVNIIDNSSIEDNDDFNIIESLVLTKNNKNLQKLKKLFKTTEILNEMSFFTNIYCLFKREFNLEEQIVDMFDYELIFYSHFPDVIFIDNIFLGENLSSNIIISNLDNETLLTLNKYYLIIYFLLLPEEKKYKFIATALKNKLIKHSYFSLSENFEIMDDDKLFLSKFISRFNQKKINSDYFKSKIDEFTKNKINKYSDIKEIELFFLNFIEYVKNLITYDALSKNIKNIQYQNEIKVLSQILLTSLKKDDNEQSK